MKKIIIYLIVVLMPVMVSGQVLYRQDFGGNRVKDDSISQKIFKSCKYRQAFRNDDGSEVGTFSIGRRLSIMEIV